jgi:hypothetical protein
MEKSLSIRASKIVLISGIGGVAPCRCQRSLWPIPQFMPQAYCSNSPPRRYRFLVPRK